jgi:hypothetical protein
MRYIILSLLFLHNAWALKTIYQWRMTKENKLTSGKCFEVDAETEGSKYQNIVEETLCRPKDYVYTFNYDDGNCYEADNDTLGKFYFNKTSITNCRPKNTQFIIGKFKNVLGCYEVDKETNGKKFYDYTNKKNCSDDYNYLWVQISETKGQCFKVSNVDPKARLRARTHECKPKKTNFIFLRHNQFRGTCVEVHPEDPKLYTHKTEIENCRPENTLFVFYREDEFSKGTCYEVDEEDSW